MKNLEEIERINKSLPPREILELKQESLSQNAGPGFTFTLDSPQGNEGEADPETGDPAGVDEIHSEGRSGGEAEGPAVGHSNGGETEAEDLLDAGAKSGCDPFPPPAEAQLGQVAAEDAGDEEAPGAVPAVDGETKPAVVDGGAVVTAAGRPGERAESPVAAGQDRPEAEPSEDGVRPGEEDRPSVRDGDDPVGPGGVESEASGTASEDDACGLAKDQPAGGEAVTWKGRAERQQENLGDPSALCPGSGDGHADTAAALAGGEAPGGEPGGFVADWGADFGAFEAVGSSLDGGKEVKEEEEEDGRGWAAVVDEAVERDVESDEAGDRRVEFDDSSDEFDDFQEFQSGSSSVPEQPSEASFDQAIMKVKIRTCILLKLKLISCNVDKQSFIISSDW